MEDRDRRAFSASKSLFKSELRLCVYEVREIDGLAAWEHDIRSSRYLKWRELVHREWPCSEEDTLHRIMIAAATEALGELVDDDDSEGKGDPAIETALLKKAHGFDVREMVALAREVRSA